MMTSAVFAAILLLARLALAGALETRRDIPAIPGYVIEQMSWEVPATPGGPALTLNGTVQQVIAQLEQINPNYRAEMLNENLASDKAVNTRDLDKRYRINSASCEGRWVAAKLGPVQDGINYLRGVPGRPGSAPGPGACVRVSCSWNSGIYWCNDNPYSKELDGYWAIADGAESVVTNCKRVNADWGQIVAGGQVFYDDSWNVIVRDDWC